MDSQNIKQMLFHSHLVCDKVFYKIFGVLSTYVLSQETWFHLMLSIHIEYVIVPNWGSLQADPASRCIRNCSYIWNIALGVFTARSGATKSVTEFQM